MGMKNRKLVVEAVTSIVISSLGFFITALYLTFKHYEKTGGFIGKAFAEPVEYALVFSTIPLYLGLGYIFFKEKTTIRELEIHKDRLEGKVRERTAELDEKNRHLVESNRLKEVFADVMHHDLLNPLGAANSIATMALRDENDPQKREDLVNIKMGIDKGIELIESATELSKLDNVSQFNYEDIDLMDTIERACKSFEWTASEAGIEIENRINKKMPIKANNIIEEVFSNLISNAIKYASTGGKITIEGEDEAGQWLIRVVDFGDGVKDEYKTAIFDRLVRKDREGVKGTGLGLAIVKKIVEIHKGEVWVEDNPDGGAVFMVKIPKGGNSDGQGG